MINPNSTWRNKKNGKTYKVWNVGPHTETQEIMVMYENNVGETFVRPRDLFLEKFDQTHNEANTEVQKLMVIVDPQIGFAQKYPQISDALESALQAVTNAKIVYLSWHNQPNSAYENRLDYHAMMMDDPKATIALQHQPDMIIHRNTYSGAKEIIDWFGRNIEVQLCGFELDACILATAFGLWDVGIPFVVMSELSGSGVNREAMKALYQRQFGKAVWV